MNQSRTPHNYIATLCSCSGWKPFLPKQNSRKSVKD